MSDQAQILDIARLDKVLDWVTWGAYMFAFHPNQPRKTKKAIVKLRQKRRAYGRREQRRLIQARYLTIQLDVRVLRAPVAEGSTR